jgi:hypothetical protein
LFEQHEAAFEENMQGIDNVMQESVFGFDEGPIEP